MTETRGITFDELLKLCNLTEDVCQNGKWITRCDHPEKRNKGFLCCDANCPIWAKLKKYDTTVSNTQEN
jgi:hypothetical protein